MRRDIVIGLLLVTSSLGVGFKIGWYSGRRALINDGARFVLQQLKRNLEISNKDE